MKQQPKTVGRFKKMEVAWIFICLCFENIANASTLKPGTFSKDGQSLNAQHTDKKNTDESITLTRKSRALLYNEYPAAILNWKNGFDGQYFGSNIASESKRNKGSLIPFPRLGRSGKFDENSIMPYPDSWLTPYVQKSKEEPNEVEESILDEMEINADYREEINSVNDEQPTINEDEDEFLKESSLFPKVKTLLESSSLIKERQVENNGTVIPYPRLGRKKHSSDSLIPQFRYGRSASPETLLKLQKQQQYILPNYRPGRSSSGKTEQLKYVKISRPAILPYPRPGKRNDYMLPVPRFGKSVGEDIYLQKALMNSPLMKEDIFKETTDDSSKADKSTIFLIPYPRPGKRFFGTKPLPPNVKLETKDKLQLLQDNKDDEIPSPFVVPYPRPGRSDNQIPSLIPSVRFGRSSTISLVPYPRLGRSNTDQNNQYILPYVRSRRSNSIMPNVRFGRSDHSILPSFRFGRSSTSILPYPRLGRFSNKKLKSKNSNSEFLLPYPRLGRRSSSGIIPQIRVGRSRDILPSVEDLDEIDTHFEILGDMKNDYSTQIGKEEELQKETFEDSVSEDSRMKSALLRPAKKLHKHMLTSDTHYMLPYPRPGRLV